MSLFLKALLPKVRTGTTRYSGFVRGHCLGRAAGLRPLNAVSFQFVGVSLPESIVLHFIVWDESWAISTGLPSQGWSWKREAGFWLPSLFRVQWCWGAREWNQRVKGTLALKSHRLKPFQTACVHRWESLLKSKGLFKLCFALAFLLLCLKHLLVGELAREEADKLLLCRGQRSVWHLSDCMETTAQEWSSLWWEHSPCALYHWQALLAGNIWGQTSGLPREVSSTLDVKEMQGTSYWSSLLLLINSIVKSCRRTLPNTKCKVSF